MAKGGGGGGIEALAELFPLEQTAARCEARGRRRRRGRCRGRWRLRFPENVPFQVVTRDCSMVLRREAARGATHGRRGRRAPSIAGDPMKATLGLEARVRLGRALLLVGEALVLAPAMVGGYIASGAVVRRWGASDRPRIEIPERRICTPRPR